MNDLQKNLRNLFLRFCKYLEIKKHPRQNILTKNLSLLKKRQESFEEKLLNVVYPRKLNFKLLIRRKKLDYRLVMIKAN